MMRQAIEIEFRSSRAGGFLFVLATITLAITTGSCAGPQPLRVAINSQHESAYLSFVNEANLDGRAAFAEWMAQERGVSTEEVLRLDKQISSTRNPFDAYKDSRVVSRGAVIYTVHCLGCHGADARGRGPATLDGYPANDFKTFGSRFAATLHRGAPRKWFRVIRDGAGDTVEYPNATTSAMPPFSGKLANEQIWQVITYLQTLDIHPLTQMTERG